MHYFEMKIFSHYLLISFFLGTTISKFHTISVHLRTTLLSVLKLFPVVSVQHIQMQKSSIFTVGVLEFSVEWGEPPIFFSPLFYKCLL